MRAWKKDGTGREEGRKGIEVSSTWNSFTPCQPHCSSNIMYRDQICTHSDRNERFEDRIRRRRKEGHGAWWTKEGGKVGARSVQSARSIRPRARGVFQRHSRRFPSRRKSAIKRERLKIKICQLEGISSAGKSASASTSEGRATVDARSLLFFNGIFSQPTFSLPAAARVHTIDLKSLVNPQELEYLRRGLDEGGI